MLTENQIQKLKERQQRHDARQEEYRQKKEQIRQERDLEKRRQMQADINALEQMLSATPWTLAQSWIGPKSTHVRLFHKQTLRYHWYPGKGSLFHVDSWKRVPGIVRNPADVFAVLNPVGNCHRALEVPPIIYT